MSRQLGSLHRSNSHPTNLTTPITIIPLFAFPPPDFPTSNVTSGMNSDSNSHISVLYCTSQLNNPNIETPDEFADSEPSPSNNFHTNPSIFSHPPFQPMLPNNPVPTNSTPSYASQVTPTYSSHHSDRSSNSPDTPQISPELDNFITLQQQPYHLDTPTINHISSTIDSSNPPTPTPSSIYTESLAPSSTSTESSLSTNRAYRTFKRKFPNHPFPAKPGTAREYINHPNHTNTKEFLAITLPSFPQYTLNTPHDTNETLNPDEDKYYLLTPYPTLMQSLKKFSPESIRAIARNPNIDLQSIAIYPKSDIQHHIRTQQFQELLTQMDTIQRQSIDQNLHKLAETAGFADIYTQDYSGYFKDIKDYIYLNGEKYRPQDISPINIFSFVTLKNEILDFLGWPYYILEKLTILYAMFNFIGFLFSLLKGIYNTCAIHTQVNRQASVARILFAGFFGIFSTSINKILLDAQIKEYNTKIATRQNTYDEEHNNVDTTPTAPQLPPLPHNHPLSLAPRNFRNLAITHNPNFRPTISQSPIQHIMTRHSQDENTYEQIIEQPHTTAFQSQNNNFFSPR